MPKTFLAPYAQTPKTFFAVVTGADSVTDNAPSNTVLLGVAGAEGAIITSLTAMPRATITPSGLHLFISKDGGVTKNIEDSAGMSGHTVSAATAIPVTIFERITEDNPFRVEADDQIYVGSGVALPSGIVFTAQITDY